MAPSHEDAPAGDMSSRPRPQRLHALPLVVGIVAVIVSLWLPWLETNKHMSGCFSCVTSVTYTAWESANVGFTPVCIGLPLLALSVAAFGVIVQRRLRIAFLILLIWPVLGALGALVYGLLMSFAATPLYFRGPIVDDNLLWGAWLCLTGYAIAFIGVLVLLPLYRQHRQRARSE